MMIPLHITFRNMEHSTEAEEWIRAGVLKLEGFCNRIVGCRVTVEMPHSHRKEGGQYHIRIDITVPGTEIVVKREPSLVARARQMKTTDMRKQMDIEVPHKDLRRAIDDAFKAAGRRLQDYVRRQRGDVKAHEGSSQGTVSKLLAKDGYGFLTAADGHEIYFQRESVLHQGFPRLRIGTPVIYVEEPGEKGSQASTVRLA